MNMSHIEWTRKRMKVDLAVQTLSQSTATSMEYLMNKGIPEFAGAESTIEFTRVFNKLTDIFNTKNENNEDIFKRALSVANAEQIFAFFLNAINYIKGLKVINKKGEYVKVCNSIINTGFNGFIINMTSLKLLFQDLVQEKQITEMLRTYCFQQDSVEIFFGN